MVARTVAIDADLRNAPAPEVTILGADLDERAWRRRELAQSLVFEPDKPGIIFIGITDKGEIKSVSDPDKAQKDISSWAKSCFPPLPVISRAVTVDGKTILAVVVPASTLKPHLAKAAIKRIGSQTLQAGQAEIDEWLIEIQKYVTYWKRKVKSCRSNRDGIAGSTR